MMTSSCVSQYGSQDWKHWRCTAAAGFIEGCTKSTALIGLSINGIYVITTLSDRQFVLL